MAILNFLTSTITSLFWFLVVLIPLVVVHEFGHLLIARLFGVKIPEFGVGMPLTRHRISKVYRGITWSFYPWLLGGFVRIFGDHDAIDEAYNQYKTNPEKAKIDYKADRFNEIIQTQELKQFLEENSLDLSSDWIFFDNLALNYKDKMTLADYYKALSFCAVYPHVIQNLPFFSKFNSNPKKVVNFVTPLNDDEIEVLKDAFQKEFNSKKDTMETLVEWEFEAKISNGNERAINNTFFAKNWFQQSAIIFGGVIFNMLTAWFLLIIVFGFFGTINASSTLDKQPIFWNQVQAWQKDSQVNLLTPNLMVTYLVKDSAADKAGLKPRDELIKINDQSLEKVDTFDTFKSYIQKAQTPINLEYKSHESGDIKTTQITPQIESGVAKLGIGVGYVASRKATNPWQAISLGFGETFKVTTATLSSLGDLAKAPFQADKSALNSAGGPILVAYISNQIFSLEGIRGILYFMATISVGLAIFNLLPIPALDGGRFVILSLNKIFGKRNKRIEALAISTTFILLILLAVVIAGNDIYRIFNKSLF